MRVVIIEENQKEIWNRFIVENSSESFLQAWEWGEFNRALGRKVWRIGIVENSLFGEGKTKESRIKNHELRIKLLGVALVIKYNLPLGRSYLYCPRMMEIGNWKLEIGKFLFEEIRKIAEKENSLFLRFDPAIRKNHESRITNHEFNNYNFKKAPNEIQPRNTLILDLTKSEEELLKEMKQKTRYNIRLAGKKELRIASWELGIKNHESRIKNQEYFKKNFEGFWELMRETARRDNFRSHNKNYYWQMLENLGSVENPPLTPPKRGIISTSSQERNNLHAKLYLAEHNKKIIAANIVLFFGDYCVYLHGASSGKYRNLMAPYLLQWRQILDAKKAGCKKYDFWGIKGSRKSIKSKVHKVESDWGGITRFKKGFGGEERNYVGAWDLVFDRWGYKLYRLIKIMRKNISG